MSGHAFEKIQGLRFALLKGGYAFYPRTQETSEGVYNDGTVFPDFIIENKVFSGMRYKKTDETYTYSYKGPTNFYYGNQFFFDGNDVYSWWHSGCGDGPLLSDVFYTTYEVETEFFVLANKEEFAYYYPFLYNGQFVFNAPDLKLHAVRPILYKNGKIFYDFDEDHCVISGFCQYRYTLEDGTIQTRYLVAKSYATTTISTTLTAYQLVDNVMVAISSVFVVCPPEGETWNYSAVLAIHAFWPMRFNALFTEAAMLYCTSFEGDYNEGIRDIVNTVLITIVNHEESVTFSKTVVLGTRNEITVMTKEQEYQDPYDQTINYVAHYLDIYQAQRNASWPTGLAYDSQNVLQYGSLDYVGNSEKKDVGFYQRVDTSFWDYHEYSTRKKTFTKDYTITFKLGDSTIDSDQFVFEIIHFDSDGDHYWNTPDFGYTVYYGSSLYLSDTDAFYDIDFVNKELFVCRIQYIDIIHKVLLYNKTDIVEFIDEVFTYSVDGDPTTINRVKTNNINYEITIKGFIDSTETFNESKIENLVTSETNEDFLYDGIYALAWSQYYPISNPLVPIDQETNNTGYENAIYFLSVFSGYKSQLRGRGASADNDEFEKHLNISHSFVYDLRNELFKLEPTDFSWACSLSVDATIVDVSESIDFSYFVAKTNSLFGTLNSHVFYVDGDGNLLKDSPITDPTLMVYPIGLY